jgi:hypothetical protein
MHHLCFTHLLANLFSHLDVCTWYTASMIPCDTLEWSQLCILMGFLDFGGEKLDLILHYNVNGTFNKCVFYTMSWQNFDVSHNYVNIIALLFDWMQIFAFFQPENLIFVIYTRFSLERMALIW